MSHSTQWILCHSYCLIVSTVPQTTAFSLAQLTFQSRNCRTSYPHDAAHWLARTERVGEAQHTTSIASSSSLPSTIAMSLSRAACAQLTSSPFTLGRCKVRLLQKRRRAGSQVVGSPVLLVVGPYLATVTSLARGGLTPASAPSQRFGSDPREPRIWTRSDNTHAMPGAQLRPHCAAIGHASQMLGSRPHPSPEAAKQHIQGKPSPG